MDIKFQKLYRYERLREHCQIAIPFAKGALMQEKKVQVLQNGQCMPSQKKVTSRYEDGSIRYLFVRFLANLPANDKTVLQVEPDCDKVCEYEGIQVTETEKGYQVKAGVDFAVSHDSGNVFDWLSDGRKKYGAHQFVGPYLKDGEGNSYGVRLGRWRIMEEGPLVAILRCMGECTGAKHVTFELKLTAYAEKPWVEISYRIINSTDNPLHVASLTFALLEEEADYNAALIRNTDGDKMDSTGCGDMNTGSVENGLVYHTIGINELPEIEKECPVSGIRTCTGQSNYKTKFSIGRDGHPVCEVVDAAFLVGEMHEHFTEVLYGTFFADRTDEQGGVCATIFQAKQNYPKAVKADESGVYVMLVPEDVDRVVMESGMSREQRFLLHFHGPEETLK